MVPFERMGSPMELVVRILGLGADGGNALPPVSRAVEDLWSAGTPLDVTSSCVGDDRRLADRQIRRWCDRDKVDVVFTVGRSGHDRADFAPEMTSPLLDRTLPGVEERMHVATARGGLDLLFRGRAGLRKGTLVVNLPARPARARAIVRMLGPIVRHAIEKARGSDRECVQGGVNP